MRGGQLKKKTEDLVSKEIEQLPLANVVSNHTLKSYWGNLFEHAPDRYTADHWAVVQDKISVFTVHLSELLISRHN